MEATSTRDATTIVATNTYAFATTAPTTIATTTVATSQAEPHQLTKPAKPKKRTGTTNTGYAKIDCLSCKLMMIFP